MWQNVKKKVRFQGQGEGGKQPAGDERRPSVPAFLQVLKQAKKQKEAEERAQKSDPHPPAPRPQVTLSELTKALTTQNGAPIFSPAQPPAPTAAQPNPQRNSGAPEVGQAKPRSGSRWRNMKMVEGRLQLVQPADSPKSDAELKLEHFGSRPAEPEAEGKEESPRQRSDTWTFDATSLPSPEGSPKTDAFYEEPKEQVFDEAVEHLREGFDHRVKLEQEISEAQREVGRIEAAMRTEEEAAVAMDREIQELSAQVSAKVGELSTTTFEITRNTVEAGVLRAKKLSQLERIRESQEAIDAVDSRWEERVDAEKRAITLRTKLEQLRDEKGVREGTLEQLQQERLRLLSQGSEANEERRIATMEGDSARLEAQEQMERMQELNRALAGQGSTREALLGHVLESIASYQLKKSAPVEPEGPKALPPSSSPSPNRSISSIGGEQSWGPDSAAEPEHPLHHSLYWGRHSPRDPAAPALAAPTRPSGWPDPVRAEVAPVSPYCPPPLVSPAQPDFSTFDALDVSPLVSLSSYSRTPGAQTPDTSQTGTEDLPAPSFEDSLPNILPAPIHFNFGRHAYHDRIYSPDFPPARAPRRREASVLDSTPHSHPTSKRPTREERVVCAPAPHRRWGSGF